jgi:ssDNA thymidine ADP-ribosyltransferase, DarT
MSAPPENPKIYHIVHVDRLPSIVADGHLFSDGKMIQRAGAGTTIGMDRIKQRRLNDLELESHAGLMVGQCVPFYYCPRSVMLYLLHMSNHPDLTYRGGQGPIVHLEFDLHTVLEWAESEDLRWALTLSNAGAYGFEDRCNEQGFTEIDWKAVQSDDWRDPDVKHRKQAEFLVEDEVPWSLVERIGVHSQATGRLALAAISDSEHRPPVEIKHGWYY